MDTEQIARMLSTQGRHLTLSGSRTRLCNYTHSSLIYLASSTLGWESGVLFGILWRNGLSVLPSSIHLDIFSNYWSWINFSRRGYFHLCQSRSMELTKRIPAQRTNSVAPSMIQIYVIQNNVLYYFYYYFFLWVAFVIWKYFLSRGSFRFPVSRWAKWKKPQQTFWYIFYTHLMKLGQRNNHTVSKQQQQQQ